MRAACTPFKGILLLLMSGIAFAQPTRQVLVPVPSDSRTYWDDQSSNVTIGIRCSAHATERYPVPVEFVVFNTAITDSIRARAWDPLLLRSTSPPRFQIEWESDDSDGYHADYGSISYASHREAFIGTRMNRDGDQEEYIRTYLTIPVATNGQNPLEVAKDAARKGIPMKWRIEHPSGAVVLHIYVDWNSIMGSCGRTDFVGGTSPSLTPAQISNARHHVQEASKALGRAQR